VKRPYATARTGVSVISWELPIQDVEDAESAGVGVGKILRRRTSGSEARRGERTSGKIRLLGGDGLGGGGLPVVGQISAATSAVLGGRACSLQACQGECFEVGASDPGAQTVPSRYHARLLSLVSWLRRSALRPEQWKDECRVQSRVQNVRRRWRQQVGMSIGADRQTTEGSELATESESSRAVESSSRPGWKKDGETGGRGSAAQPMPTLPMTRKSMGSDPGWRSEIAPDANPRRLNAPLDHCALRESARLHRTGPEHRGEPRGSCMDPIPSSWPKA
jgi:hypothetical protein